MGDNVGAMRASGTGRLVARPSAPTIGSPAFHMPSLDGIRAVSIMIVFLSHVGYNGFIPAQFGVTIFFFLSGFLITTLLRREFAATNEISLGHFYLRRALRILPPFYAVFLLAYLLSIVGITRAATEPASSVSVVLHWANYYIVGHGDHGFVPGAGVYWSLAVEEHFYLIFPLLFILLLRSGLTPRRMATVLLGVCAVVLAWRMWLWSTSDLTAPFHRLAVATDARFDSLLYGCVLAVVGNPALDRSRFSERAWKYGFLPLGLAGLILCFVIRSDEFRQTLRYSIQGLSLIPVFVCAVRYPNWGLMRPLNWRPVAFVGVLSYSMYLCHLMVLSAISEQVPDLPQSVHAVIGLALSIGLSWAIYLMIEQPSAALRRRLTA